MLGFAMISTERSFNKLTKICHIFDAQRNLGIEPIGIFFSNKDSKHVRKKYTHWHQLNTITIVSIIGQLTHAEKNKFVS